MHLSLHLQWRGENGVRAEVDRHQALVRNKSRRQRKFYQLWLLKLGQLQQILPQKLNESRRNQSLRIKKKCAESSCVSIRVVCRKGMKISQTFCCERSNQDSNNGHVHFLYARLDNFKVIKCILLQTVQSSFWIHNKSVYYSDGIWVQTIETVDSVPWFKYWISLLLWNLNTGLTSSPVVKCLNLVGYSGHD